MFLLISILRPIASGRLSESVIRWVKGYRPAGGCQSLFPKISPNRKSRKNREFLGILADLTDRHILKSACVYGFQLFPAGAKSFSLKEFALFAGVGAVPSRLSKKNNLHLCRVKTLLGTRN
jgi:hypothetical protein